MLATLALAFALQEPLVLQRIVDPASGPVLVQAVGVTGRVGDDRLFVTEIGGYVRIVADGVVQAAPFVDVTGHVIATGLAGLRATAFHPDYDSNGFFYLWYDATDGVGGIDLVLARMTRDAADDQRLDPASLVELLRVHQDQRGHGGGSLQFGPDGMLWIGLGDGGIQHDLLCRSQDPASLLGKILRLDVDAGMPYGIPTDNPFVGVAGYAPEIAHIGFRHPWKWSFDRVTGDLWIGDVGQEQREEVNFAAAGTLGVNYGWPVMEGELCHTSTACAAGLPLCDDPVLEAPAFAYPHTDGCSITGGFVYRGHGIPELVGQYLATDFCTRRTWTVERTTGGFVVIERDVQIHPAPAVPLTVSSFGEDRDGELLVLDHGSGSIYRLVRPCGASTTCFGEPNSVGTRSVLRFNGSTQFSANDVTVSLASLPALTPALLFMGPETADVPVAGGRLCVGGSIQRIGVRFAGLEGDTSFPLDLTSPPFTGGGTAIGPGSTVTFQAWYRDIGGPSGGTSNFTSATTVTFCP